MRGFDFPQAYGEKQGKKRSFPGIGGRFFLFLSDFSVFRGDVEKKRGSFPQVWEIVWKTIHRESGSSADILVGRVISYAVYRLQTGNDKNLCS